MLIKKPGDIRYSEITPKPLYLDRRKFLAAIPAALIGGRALRAGTKLPNVGKSPLSTTETPNSYQDVTSYNNFYEFGTAKNDPVKNAQHFKTSPWTVSVEGLVAKPRKFPIEELMTL